jgi:murein L,D-transpeptidase YcbB/YkuD
VLLAAAKHLVVAETASAKLEPVQGAGLKTRAEIREFQRGHGLKADGIMGPDGRSSWRSPC